jgi:hypothetical protein
MPYDSFSQLVGCIPVHGQLGGTEVLKITAYSSVTKKLSCLVSTSFSLMFVKSSIFWDIILCSLLKVSQCLSRWQAIPHNYIVLYNYSVKHCQKLLQCLVLKLPIMIMYTVKEKNTPIGKRQASFPLWWDSLFWPNGRWDTI